MTNPIRVIPLDCATCQKPLLGLPNDTAFTCIPCESVLSVNAHSTAQIPLRIAEPSETTDAPVIYLPMYHFALQSRILDAQGTDITSETPLPEHAWVCGFQEFRPAYFGNPGVDMTTAQCTPLALDTPPPQFRLLGIARSLEEAARYPQLFISLLLDRRRDITGQTIEVDTSAPALWAIPFALHEDENTLVNLLTAHRYATRMVETLSEMR
ncbi:MAG: hypothetical protein GX146_07735 [Myxococcales bacterium]|nr:hypothetical protein [Myxococcales bacterium]